MSKNFYLFKIIFFLFLIIELKPQIEKKFELPSSATINVTIGGSFIVNGSFPGFINERVDQFITRIYFEAKKEVTRSLTEKELIDELNNKIGLYALRNITIKRIEEQLKIDLAKFRLNGDFKNNPYLKNDDVIIFPPLDLERNFFSIDGAVNKPAKIEFVDGDKLSDAIEFAQGINKAYENISQVEITRLSYDGLSMNKQIFNLSDDVKLERGDRIKVLSNETQKKDFKVLVIGEVKKPGYYPISKEKTNFEDIINNCGGFTNEASLKNIRIFNSNNLPIPIIEKLFTNKIETFNSKLKKEILSFFEEIEKSQFYRMSNLTEEDTAYFFMENRLKVNFESRFINYANKKDSEELSKIILKDNEIIYIPSKEKDVYIFGQVRITGPVLYEEGQNFNYYIQKAGGLGKYADDEIVLIKAESREWIPLSNKNTIIEAGDYIFVPKEPIRSFKYYLTLASSYLSVLGSAATIILLLLQLTK